MSNSSLPTIEPYNPDGGDAFEPQIDQSYDQTTDSAYLDPTVSTDVDYYEDLSLDDFDSGGRGIPWFLLAVGGFIILGVLVLVFLLLGQSGTSDGDTTDSTTGTIGDVVVDQPVRINWWGAFLDEAAVAPLIEEYQNLNPNITIIYEDKWPLARPFLEAQRSYRSELNRVVGSGNEVEIPNIYMVKNTWFGDYEGFASPAPSGVYTLEDYAATYYEQPVRDYARTGQILAAPLWMDTLAIIYNKDLLAANNSNQLEPPESWEEFRNLAVSLTITDSGEVLQSGFAAGDPDNTSFAFELFNTLLLQNGVEIVNENGLPSFASDPATLPTLSFYKSFISARQTWDEDLSYDAATFLEENTAMIVGMSWRLRDILNQNDANNIGLDIDVARLPQLDGQDSDIINWSESWANVVSNAHSSVASQASWEFVKWLNEPEQQRQLHDNIEVNQGQFGHLYPRQDMAEDLQGDEYLRIYNEALETSRSWFMVRGIEVVELFDEYLRSSSTSNSRLESLQGDVTNIINQKGQLPQ